MYRHSIYMDYEWFVVVLALVAAAQCSVVPVANVDTDYSSFSYDVADPNTGDYKSQVETRVGGSVTGQYSLVDPDGTKRTVDYVADDVNGFNAVVRKDPLVAPAVVAAAPAVVDARSVVAAPAVYATSAPAVVAARTVVPGLVSARYAAPTVYSSYAPSVYRSYAPSVYSAGVVPSVYTARAYSPYYAGSPLAYSNSLSYW
ncbi:hypothetical protein K1T71_002829 [Dendrolimus kikuchii]|uniref:Uncharacterized protein n=1 Tax=Dendrolimus kikuchii TaxID=765133 RepID=A0ACC1DFB4_9NEOP|nr:hypothetical protein K1T71_002829 [Dendrolimus kikuchii]